MYHNRLSKLKAKHAAFPLGLILLLTSFQPVLADTQVELQVFGCNNNNICEPGLTEDNFNCSNDCNPCNNNNICEVLKGESYGSCPSDCQPAPTALPSASAQPAPGGSFGSRALYIRNVDAAVKPDSAIVTWDSSVPTFGQIQWGTTADYDLGSVDKIAISMTHSVALNGLSENTVYFFKITASLPGVLPVEYVGSFTTSGTLDVTPPANVSHLKLAKEGADTVLLSWQNPADLDFAGVKILQSPYFYPKNSSDGKLIYEGQGTYARDINIDFNKTYYYTVYSYDRSGNYSSGALARFGPSKPIIDNGAVSPNKLTLQDFDFIQNHLGLPSTDSMVKLYPFYPIDISIAKSKLSDSVAYIILSIKDPFSEADTASYRLALTPDKKLFAARMGVLGSTGRYPVTFEFIDANNEKSGEVVGTFDVRVISGVPLTPVGFYIVVALLVMLYLAGRASNRHKKNDSHYSNSPEPLVTRGE